MATPAGTAIRTYVGSGNVAAKAPALRVQPRVDARPVENAPKYRRLSPLLAVHERDNSMLNRGHARSGECGLESLVEILSSSGDVGRIVGADARGSAERALRDPAEVSARVPAAVMDLQRPADREGHVGWQSGVGFSSLAPCGRRESLCYVRSVPDVEPTDLQLYLERHLREQLVTVVIEERVREEVEVRLGDDSRPGEERPHHVRPVALQVAANELDLATACRRIGTATYRHSRILARLMGPD